MRNLLQLIAEQSDKTLTECAVDLWNRLVECSDCELLGIIAEGYDEVDRQLHAFMQQNSLEFKQRVLKSFANMLSANGNKQLQQELAKRPVLRQAIDYIFDMYNEMIRSEEFDNIIKSNGDKNVINAVDLTNTRSRSNAESIPPAKLLKYRQYVQGEIKRSVSDWFDSAVGKSAAAAADQVQPQAAESVTDAPDEPEEDARTKSGIVRYFSSWMNSGASVDQIVDSADFNKIVVGLERSYLPSFLRHAASDVKLNHLQSHFYLLGNKVPQSYSTLWRLVGEGSRVTVDFLRPHYVAAARLGPYISMSYIMLIMRKYNLNREQAFVRYCYSLANIADELASDVDVQSLPNDRMRL